MTPRRRRWVFLAVLLAGIGVTVSLVLLTVPIAQESSGYTLVGLRLYSFEAENLFGAPPPPTHFVYRGVHFDFVVYCPSTPVGLICGNVTESGGATFAFTFFEPEVPGAHNWETWVAPDGNEAAQYQPGGLVHLLVEV